MSWRQSSVVVVVVVKWVSLLQLGFFLSLSLSLLFGERERGEQEHLFDPFSSLTNNIYE